MDKQLINKIKNKLPLTKEEFKKMLMVILSLKYSNNNIRINQILILYSKRLNNYLEFKDEGFDNNIKDEINKDEIISFYLMRLNNYLHSKNVGFDIYIELSDSHFPIYYNDYIYYNNELDELIIIENREKIIDDILNDE